MKHAILWITFLLISFTGFAQSEPKKDTSIVEKTKIVVQNGVTAIDTSSNFKMIYSDLKDGVTALASALKVGTEHVYEVIVKQQIVNSITWTIILVLMSLLGWYGGKWYFTNWKSVIYANNFEPTIVLVFIYYVLYGIIFFVSIGGIVTGFVNPEYSAIKQVVEIVSELKNK